MSSDKLTEVPGVFLYGLRMVMDADSSIPGKSSVRFTRASFPLLQEETINMQSASDRIPPTSTNLLILFMMREGSLNARAASADSLANPDDI